PRRRGATSPSSLMPTPRRSLKKANGLLRHRRRSGRKATPASAGRHRLARAVRGFLDTRGGSPTPTCIVLRGEGSLNGNSVRTRDAAPEQRGYGGCPDPQPILRRDTKGWARTSCPGLQGRAVCGEGDRVSRKPNAEADRGCHTRSSKSRQVPV